MKVTNNMYYCNKDLAVLGNDVWVDGFATRITIHSETENFSIETIEGMVATLPISHMWELHQTLGKVQNEVITSVIGAPNNA